MDGDEVHYILKFSIQVSRASFRFAMPTWFEIFSLVSLLTKILVFLIYAIIRWRLYWLSFKLPGPFYLPFIGNLYKFFFKKGNFLKRANEIILDNPKMFRFWFGPKLLVIVREPEAVEKILNSSLPIVDGPDSFIESEEKNDEKWRSHKKILKPMLNLKFVIDNINTYQKHFAQFDKTLEFHANKTHFDIHRFIHQYYADVFGEMFLGDLIGAQYGKNSDFINSAKTLHKYSHWKILLSWINLGFLFKCTKYNRITAEVKTHRKYFVENIIRKSWERRKMDVFGENITDGLFCIVPLVDTLAQFIESNPNVISNENFRDYLIDIFFASLEKISIITSMCCLCFGMDPEQQILVYNEIVSVINSTQKVPKYEDFNKLKYLEACILEVIRLTSTKPLILRNFRNLFEIDNLKIPSQCTIIIASHLMERDIVQFEKPDQFHPAHFLPENIKKRTEPNYSSFGTGTRECMGKLLTMVSVKIMLINILKKYTIEAEGDITKVEMFFEYYSRPTNGCKIKLNEREKLKY